MFVGVDGTGKGFADRFEPDGDHYLFRPTSTAAPKRITAAEYRDVVRRYWFAVRLLTALTIGSLVTVVAAHLVLGEGRDPTIPEGVALALVFGIVYRGYAYVWARPDRLFERRADAGRARTKEEIARRQLQDSSWRTVWIGFFALAVDGGRHLLDPSKDCIEHLIWGGFVVLALLASVPTVYRRWHWSRGR